MSKRRNDIDRLALELMGWARCRNAKNCNDYRETVYVGPTWGGPHIQEAYVRMHDNWDPFENQGDTWWIMRHFQNNNIEVTIKMVPGEKVVKEKQEPLGQKYTNKWVVSVGHHESSDRYLQNAVCDVGMKWLDDANG